MWNDVEAVVFDIGRTLVGYNKPLNWSGLYRPAMEQIADTYGYPFGEKDYRHAIRVLTKYNTRVNPREYEVSSTQIFTEIVDGISAPMEDLEQIKHSFYSFFRREAVVYSEVEPTLRRLADRGILLGTLSDVAYGMDNTYVLDDIAPLRSYIQYPFTSNDVGYRKPSVRGLLFVADKMKVPVSKIIFVGDEEKDMICAKNAGAYAVLINRDGTKKEFSQDREIRSLEELLEMV